MPPRQMREKGNQDIESLETSGQRVGTYHDGRSTVSMQRALMDKHGNFITSPQFVSLQTAVRRRIAAQPGFEDESLTYSAATVRSGFSEMISALHVAHFEWFGPCYDQWKVKEMVKCAFNNRC